jgi:hypothetical protein
MLKRKSCHSSHRREAQSRQNCVCVRHDDRPARHSSERVLVKHRGDVRAAIVQHVTLPFESDLDELLTILVRPIRVCSPGHYLGVRSPWSIPGPLSG